MPRGGGATLFSDDAGVRPTSAGAPATNTERSSPSQSSPAQATNQAGSEHGGPGHEGEDHAGLASAEMSSDPADHFVGEVGFLAGQAARGSEPPKWARSSS